MKTLTLFLLSSVLTSTVFAAIPNIAGQPVKDCTLIVPHDADENLSAALVKKGYHPFVSYGQTHDVTHFLSGNLSAKMNPSLDKDSNFAGAPVLTMDKDISAAEAQTHLAVHIAGHPNVAAFASDKHTWFPLRAGAEVYSVTDLPTCVEN